MDQFEEVLDMIWSMAQTKRDLTEKLIFHSVAFNVACKGVH